MEQTLKEKILWNSFQAVYEKFHEKGYEFEIYTSSCTNYDEVKTFVLNAFNIQLPENIILINIPCLKFLANPLINNSGILLFKRTFLSIKAAILCLFKNIPEVLIDTYGIPFAAPMWKIMGCKTIGYFLQPPIEITQHKAIFNSIGKNGLEEVLSFTKMKRIRDFYLNSLVLFWYWFNCNLYDVLFTSNSISYRKFLQIFGYQCLNLKILYPSLDCEQFHQIPYDKRETGLIISIGKFDSKRQIDFQIEIIKNISKTFSRVHLIIFGFFDKSNDNENTNPIYQSAKNIIETQKLPIVLLPNPDPEQIKLYLGKAQVGIQTQENVRLPEDIILFLSSGIIPIARNSGSAANEIFKGENQYLAESIDEYTEKIIQAIQAPIEEREKMRKKTEKYSQKYFSDEFTKTMMEIVSI